MFDLSQMVSVSKNGLKLKPLCLWRCSCTGKMFDVFVNDVFNWIGGLHHWEWGVLFPVVDLVVLFASVDEALLDFFVNCFWRRLKEFAFFCALAVSAFVHFVVITFIALLENFNKSASTVDHTVVDNGLPGGFLMIRQIAAVEKVCQNKLLVVPVAGMFVEV